MVWLLSQVFPSNLVDHSGLNRDSGATSYTNERTPSCCNRSLSVREHLGDEYNISGWPFSIEWLTKQQRIGFPFGAEDNREPQHPRISER